jgi:hypothetical protein
MSIDRDQLGGFEKRLEDELSAFDESSPRAGRAARRRGVRRRRALVLAGGFAGALALSAAAVAVLTDNATFQPDPNSVVRGGELVMKGSGCDAGAAVSFAMDGARLSGTTARNDGTFIATIGIPVGAEPGTHALSATCRSGDADRVQHATVEVLASAPPLGESFAIAGDATAGEETFVKGSGCTDGAAVTITLDADRDIGQLEAGSNGAFAGPVTIPSSVTPGSHDMTATCAGEDGDPLVQNATIAVSA